MATEEVPPAYQEVFSALNDVVKADPVAAHKAITASLKKESANVLVQQSRDLSETISTLKKLFEAVSLNLIRVDKALTSGGPRRPTWTKIYDDYKALIDETKADAITARAFAQKYLESVLTAAQDDSLSLDEKIKEIDLFLAEADKQSKNAKNYSERFTAIKDRVYEFREKLILDYEVGVDELQGKIDKCKQDIIKIETDLKYWEKTAKGALWFLSGGVGVGALVLGACGEGALFAGAATLFGCATVFSPIGLGLLIVAALGVAISGIVAAVARAKANGYAEDLVAKKRELVELETKLKTLQDLRPIIERSIADMGDIGEKLTILSSVWKAFAEDANEIKALLEAGRGSKDNKFNPESVATAVNMYKGLSDSMGVYAALI